LKFTVALLATAILLGACGGAGSQPPVTITIEGGAYILPRDRQVSEDRGYLALEITVTNETNESLHLSSFDFSLYDDNNTQVTSEDIFSRDNTFNEFDWGALSAGMNRTGYIIFPVDKTQTYTLHYTHSASLEATVVEIELDITEFEDNTLDAITATTALIEEIFLARSNNDYQDFIANDREDLITLFENYFTGAIQGQFWSYDLSNQDALEFSEIFREMNGDVATVEYTLVSFFPNSAVVRVKPTVLVFDEIERSFESVRDEAREAALDAGEGFSESREAGERRAFEQLPELFRSSSPVLTAGFSSDGHEILLVKVDDKWEVQTTGSDAFFDSVLRAFSADLFSR